MSLEVGCGEGLGKSDGRLGENRIVVKTYSSDKDPASLVVKKFYLEK